MYDKPNMEIPQAVRELAERNIEQARQGYSQFMDVSRKVQDMVAQSSGAMAESTTRIQTRAFEFANANMQAAFEYAAELARARDLKDYMDIQSRHAQKQMQTYAAQAQELGRLMTEAAQKSQPKA